MTRSMDIELYPSVSYLLSNLVDAERIVFPENVWEHMLCDAELLVHFWRDESGWTFMGVPAKTKPVPETEPNVITIFYKEFANEPFTRFQQSIIHDPTNNQFGDCHRTAIACVLNVDPQTIPNFNEGLSDDPADGPLFDARVSLYLEKNGYTQTEILFNDLNGALASTRGRVTALLGARSSSGLCNHSWIIHNGKVAHDPIHGEPMVPREPMNNGYFSVTFLIPLRYEV